MFMKLKILFTILFINLYSIIHATPTDHGRPWDDPDYHSSPLGKIFIPIAIIVLIILAVGYISSNKEKIGGLLKSGFSIFCFGVLVFGLMIVPLIDRCDRHSSSNSNPSKTIQTSTQSNSPSSSSNSNVEKSVPQEGEVGYKTKNYRIDVCHYCHGTGKMTVDASWGKSTISCPTCGGSGKLRIPGNYR